MKWSLAVLAAVFIVFPSETLAIGQYSRTVSYQGEIVVRCPDKRKSTVAVLQKHADVFNVGAESIDLRLAGSTFYSVAQFFPECEVLVQDLEAAMQVAESQMIPKDKDRQDDWMNAVIQEMLLSSDLKCCEEEMAKIEEELRRSPSWFEEYHDYDAIVNWYTQLATDHPNLVTFVPSIGQTLEGRNMPAVHVTASSDPNRKKIYFQCMIHAREWVAGAVCMYIVNRLVNNYQEGSESNETFILDTIELVVVPIVNPDGYVYSWTDDRLWRKNRHRNPANAPCIGVDINRNFPVGWVKPNSISESCDEDYHGPSPGSELETQHIISYFRANGPFIGALDWHSYGELVLRPWGMDNHSSLDEFWLKALSTEMAHSIAAIHNHHYTSETSWDLYPCYGIAGDWFYSDDATSTNQGYRAASYCVELRGDKTGQVGFVLPADQIIPTSEEVYPGAITFILQVIENPMLYDPLRSLLAKHLLGHT